MEANGESNQPGVVSDDHDQEEKSAALPKADGPLVRVTLHDGQQFYAVVKGRRREADTSWWYLLQIHLPAATQRLGRLTDEPAPVDFTAPASRCEPIESQAYDQVPTERVGIPRHGRSNSRSTSAPSRDLPASSTAATAARPATSPAPPPPSRPAPS